MEWPILRPALFEISMQNTNVPWPKPATCREAGRSGTFLFRLTFSGPELTTLRPADTVPAPPVPLTQLSDINNASKLPGGYLFAPVAIHLCGTDAQWWEMACIIHPDVGLSSEPPPIDRVTARFETFQ